ncbi:bax inhibitor family protein [Poronia punctata]|nr:bax inhibitor family protein [Poronia punctata]
MSFNITVRQGPARLATRLPELAKSSLRKSAPIRSFHQPATKPSTFFTSRITISQSPLRTTPKNPFSQSRAYNQYQTPPAADQGSLTRRLLTGGAIFGGTLVAINAVFNRETREDGGMPAFERSYLNSTFLHTGLGIGIIGLTARQMVQTGFVYRLMVTNPWVMAIGGLALSFGTMLGTRAIEPENYIPKYALWTAFNATQAAFIAPLIAFAPGALIARAGLYTVAMMGSIAFVGATAKQEKYMYIGGPLLAGAALVAVSGFAPLILPATAIRTLAFTENIWLYGGLAVFGGFTLYDVQKILHHARLAERGIIKKDPVNESISLELDFLNIFIRMVQILMMQQNRRK